MRDPVVPASYFYIGNIFLIKAEYEKYENEKRR